MRDQSDAKKRVDVLSFFLRHPNTSDSVEGIARWRLLEEIVIRGVQETEQILDELTQLGFLEEVSAPGTPRLFRLRADNAEKAASYLQDQVEP